MIRYYRFSPRGFSNEVDVYAVDDDTADTWADEFERGLDDLTASRFDEITPKDAERLCTARWNLYGKFYRIAGWVAR